MGSEKDGEQPYQIGTYAFPGNIGGGVLNHAFMATNNQDDGRNNDNKIINSYKYTQSTRTSSESFISQSDQINSKIPEEMLDLYNLQLPQDILSDFSVMLTGLGYAQPFHGIETGILGTRKYTCLQSNDQQNPWHRYLIYVPALIITDPDPSEVNNIITLGSIFKQDAFVIVLFRSGAPDPQIGQIIESHWVKYKWRKLISWEQLQKLRKKDEATQKALLMEIFGLTIP